MYIGLFVACRFQELCKKNIFSLQEDIDTEESNDAEVEAPEGTLEAPDASEVNYATFIKEVSAWTDTVLRLELALLHL